MSGPKKAPIPLGRQATEADPLRLAILISGRGSNMKAIVQAAGAGEIPARAVFVSSDRPDAPGLLLAEAAGVAVRRIEPLFKEDPAGFYRSLAEELEREAIDLLCLAGYMRILPEWLVERFALRIINIHPSLLPAFPGLHPHRQALVHGVKLSGCTVHLVDAGVDSGPILLQEAVEVREDDDEQSLADRILAVEHRLYPEAIKRLATGRYALVGRRVVRVGSEGAD